MSFRTSVARTHAWSVFSGLSLSEVSVMSAIALPLSTTDIREFKRSLILEKPIPPAKILTGMPKKIQSNGSSMSLEPLRFWRSLEIRDSYTRNWDDMLKAKFRRKPQIPFTSTVHVFGGTSIQMIATIVS